MFGSKPDDQWILLWQLENHKSIWFQDIDLAADYVQLQPDDIYFGVGVSKKDFGPTKRCPQKAITGIPGFYVDIDIKDSKAHKGKEYPKTIDEALSLIIGHGFDPSVIINSGYGLHCYWLFEKMWMFENEPEWFRAKMLSKRMSETIKKRAIDINRDIDSIFDLSRVLRPPGSFNCKKKTKAEVLIHSINDNRYTPAFFDETLEKQPIPTSFIETPSPDEIQKEILTEPSSKKKKKIFEFNINAEPNIEKMMELSNIFENFTATWSYERSDLPSPSEYDLSLANFGATVRMTDQEICNMIIAFRRKHNLKPEKCMREDYMVRTIMKAKKKAGSDEATRIIGHINSTKGTEYENPDDNETLLEAINKRFPPYLRLKKFIRERYGPKIDEIEYLLYFEKKVIDEDGKQTWEPLDPIRGGNDFLDSRGKFEKVFTNGRGLNLAASIPTREWIKHKQAWLNIVIEIDVGDARTKEKMAGWIEDYLRNKSRKKTFADTLESSEPFMENGFWFIYLKSFLSFVYSKSLSVKEDTVLSYMREEEFIYFPKKRVVLPDGTRTGRAVWRVPKRKYQI